MSEVVLLISVRQISDQRVVPNMNLILLYFMKKQSLNKQAPDNGALEYMK